MQTGEREAKLMSDEDGSISHKSSGNDLLRFFLRDP